MDKRDQKRIIREMADGIKNLMLSKSSEIPDGWDGHELRQWFADLANEQFRFRNLDRKRMSEYKNYRLIANL